MRSSLIRGRGFHFLLALACLTIVLPSSLSASELQTEGSMARKAQRGFLNIVLAPFELASEMKKAGQEDSFIPNWFIGGARGICAMGGRALIGAYELVTFPLPLPAEYEPVIYPEFPWQLLDSDR